MKSRILLSAAIAVVLSACGLDALILSQATKKGHGVVPDPKDNVVIAQVDPALFSGAAGCPGSASLTALRGDGAVEENIVVSPYADVADTFELRMPGVEAYRGLLLLAQRGTVMALSLVPGVPKQDDVRAPEKTWVFGDGVDGALPLGAAPMGVVGVRSTALTLLIGAKADQIGIPFGAITTRRVQEAVALLDQRLSGDGSEFLDLVGQLLLCAGTMCDGPVPFLFGATDAATGAVSTVSLNPEFVTAANAQCETTLAGLSVPDFDARRLELTQDLELVQFDENRIRVVSMVDFNPGKLDRNCNPINLWKWTKDEPGKTMYLTGGVYATAPMCGGERTTHCLTVEQRSEINLALGNDADGGWQPNVIPMYDDGTHGDTLAGDRIYTVTFDFPYWNPDEAPDGAGVRLGYKYTWGRAKQGWTGTEEWPGNGHALELRDVNGDGLVIRHDFYGDETTNKDKQNLLTPRNGGCGRVVFPAEQAANPDYRDCVMDSVENQIDTNGDCVLDSWPRAPRVSPLVVE